MGLSWALFLSVCLIASWSHDSGGWRYHPRQVYEYRDYQTVDRRYATVAVRVGRRGLNFFSAIASSIMEKEIPRIQFPSVYLPITGGPGSGFAQVQDLRVSSFKSPDIKYSLQPPNRIFLHSSDGAVRIHGNWSAEYKILATMTTDGWVNAFASNIRSILTISTYGFEGRPQVKIIDCNVELGYFTMEIGGGVIPWLVNLFRNDLSDIVKEEIHSQFCTTARTTLIDVLNEQLRNLPSKMKVVDPIYVQYEYTNDPIVKNNEIVYSAYLDVTVGNMSCGSMTPYLDPMPPLEPPQPRNHYMVTLWIAPIVLQCLAESIHKANIVQFVIDENFDYGRFATFLSAKCASFEVCFGKFFPKFAEAYPNSRMALHFHLSKPVVIIPMEDHMDLNTHTFVDFHISPYDKNLKILARVELNANISVNPKIVDDRIGGVLNENMDLLFLQVFSTIGDMHESMLNLFGAMFGPVIRVLVNSQLRIGLPIPLVEDITVANGAKFSTLNDEVTRVDADLYSVTQAISSFVQL